MTIKIRPDWLQDVPETLLLPLYNRAVETVRTDAIIHDPRAVALVEQLDYDFTQFGSGHVAHAIRARVFDAWVRAFLAHQPDAVVVNLGAGLDTQFERVDNGHVQWYELDVPESIALWKRFFTETERHRTLAYSALDPAWIELIPNDRPVLFQAAGLLMYFTEAQVRQLISRLATRFADGFVQFDTISRWFSARSVAGKAAISKAYTLPAMPWGINVREMATLATWHPAIEVVAIQDYVRGYRHRWGAYGYAVLLPPIYSRTMGAMVQLRFRPA
ncbi:MAG: class I SAM-dependent methyltransferase [Chloroflexaceae bacterium]|nr:class I SAM-dependent methyltransferase [Chloroflexaceae bacterium]